MEALREKGFHCGVVERWIPGANIRRDLFGFIDVLAVTPTAPAIVRLAQLSVDLLTKLEYVPGRRLVYLKDAGEAYGKWADLVRDFMSGAARFGGIIAVQCCARGSMAAHKDKILAAPAAIDWLHSGGTIELWGWDRTPFIKQDGKAGKRMVARSKVEHITEGMFG